MGGSKENIIHKQHDKTLTFLNRVIVVCVKALAVLICLMIVWGVVLTLLEMIYLLQHEHSYSLLNTEILFQAFGYFLAVLVGIEIFLNIVFYLREEAVHVPLVLGTALTAIARKVIILDFTKYESSYLFAISILILSFGVTYWLTTSKNPHLRGTIREEKPLLNEDGH